MNVFKPDWEEWINLNLSLGNCKLIMFQKSLEAGYTYDLIKSKLNIDYQVSKPVPAMCKDKIALRNARKIIKGTNCDAVKVEGGVKIYETIKCLVNNNIPVMGHVGLLPQSVKKKSDYKVQGKSYVSFKQIIEDSIAIEKAGAFSIVVECVTKDLADKINQSVNIPTIGIGASNKCDGQILVTEDLLGYSEKPAKFVKIYDNFKERTEICIKKFVKDLKNNNFPNFKNMYQIK